MKAELSSEFAGNVYRVVVKHDDEPDPDGQDFLVLDINDGIARMVELVDYWPTEGVCFGRVDLLHLERPSHYLVYESVRPHWPENDVNMPDSIESALELSRNCGDLLALQTVDLADELTVGQCVERRPGDFVCRTFDSWGIPGAALETFIDAEVALIWFGTRYLLALGIAATDR